MKNSTKPTPNANPVIRLLGLGEAGVKLVETLAMISPEGIETYSLDTDNRSLARCHQSQTFLLGQAIPCGLGTGGDSALARAAVASDSAPAPQKGAVRALQSKFEEKRHAAHRTAAAQDR